MPGLSAAELSFLEGGISQDLRNDGRGREDFRSFSIQLDVISQVSLHRFTAFLEYNLNHPRETSYSSFKRLFSC